MDLLNRLKVILAAISIIAAVFVAVSIFDIIIASFYIRFYSNAVFIILFGVAGIFAASLSYTLAIDLDFRKTESSRWTLITIMILSGLLFFFFLAKLEGGEYEAAFKAYGATLALGSLLFAKGKVEP